MENNIIKLPGKIDVSLVEGGQLIFIINLTYDSTYSSIDDGLFLFLPDKTAGEIESAINNNNTIVYLRCPFVSEIFNLLCIDNQLVHIDSQMKSKLIWDIDNIYAYTLNWDYDPEADIPESTNSFSLLPAASFDVEVNLSGGNVINGDTIIGSIRYDYPSHKFVAEEYALNINENYVESLSSSNKAYLLGHEVFEDFNPAVVNPAAYMLNGKLYSNSTEVATQTDISTVTAVAEGKTKAYVTNKTKMSVLNSDDDTVTISSFTDLNNTSVALSNFKVGDIVYLTDTNIPDRWVSSITTSGNTVTAIVLSKLEISKVPLSDYVPKTTTIAGLDLQDNITKTELQGATDDSTHRFVTDTEKSTWNNKVSANNSTITIQKNGTTVNSFTTNASSAKTININTADDLKVKNNATSSLVSDSFLYRQTANNGAVDNGFARIEKVKGNTVVWNQSVTLAKVNTATAYNSSKTEVTVSNGEISVKTIETSSTGYERGFKILDFSSTPIVVGHNYMILCYTKSSQQLSYSVDNTFAGKMPALAVSDYAANVWCKTAAFLIASNTSNIFILRIGQQPEVDSYFYFKNLQLIDLTLMFGAGNEPSTVALFEAMFPEPYYAYDAGRLLSFNPAGLKTVGFNLFDKNDVVRGYMTNNNGQSTARLWCYSNYIRVYPNTQYYYKNLPATYLNNASCVYDKNKNFLSYLNISAGNTTEPVSAVVTTPNNAYYIRINCLITWLDDVCVSLSDASKNGTYEAHWENTCPIDITALKGRATGSTTDVVMFPDGLNGKGTCYDEIDLKLGTAVRRYGKVHLKNVVSAVYSNNGHYYCVTSAISDLKVNRQTTALSTLQCGYDGNQIYNGTYGIGYRVNEKALNIALASKPTTKAAFESALDGIYLYYELETPIEYTFDPISYTYPVDALGTEEIVSKSGTAPTTVPALMDIRYSTNVIDTVKNLPNVYVSAVQEQGFSEEEKELARNNIGAAPASEGLTSIVQTTTSSTSGGTNIITATRSDGSTSTFLVRNGIDGIGVDGVDGTLIWNANLDPYSPATGEYLINCSNLSGGQGSPKVGDIVFRNSKKYNISSIITDQSTLPINVGLVVPVAYLINEVNLQGTNGTNGQNGQQGPQGERGTNITALTLSFLEDFSYSSVGIYQSNSTYSSDYKQNDLFIDKTGLLLRAAANKGTNTKLIVYDTGINLTGPALSIKDIAVDIFTTSNDESDYLTYATINEGDVYLNNYSGASYIVRKRTSSGWTGITPSERDMYLVKNSSINELYMWKDNAWVDLGSISGTTPNITMTATVDNNTGTPSVTVRKTSSDPNNPSFRFEFKNLKSETDMNNVYTKSQVYTKTEVNGFLYGVLRPSNLIVGDKEDDSAYSVDITSSSISMYNPTNGSYTMIEPSGITGRNRSNTEVWNTNGGVVDLNNYRTVNDSYTKTEVLGITNSLNNRIGVIESNIASKFSGLSLIAVVTVIPDNPDPNILYIVKKNVS